ncbi:hypothetical protein Ancab_010485 [Ancistrocladus abbreviatus]
MREEGAFHCHASLRMSTLFRVMASNLSAALSKKSFVGVKVWVLIGIVVGCFIVVILLLLVYFCLTSRKRSKRANDGLPITQIPTFSKEIREIGVDQVSAYDYGYHDGVLHDPHDKISEKDSDKLLVHPGEEKIMKMEARSQSRSFSRIGNEVFGSQSEDRGNFGKCKPSLQPITTPSPLFGLPEFSRLGWGHWFTLRDLEIATNKFSKENVIGEGGYGVVYRAQLVNGTPVAVKRLLNNVYAE